MYYNKLSYYWSKLIKRLPLSSINDSIFEEPSKVEPRSTVINSSFGRYSYCGYNCVLINCEIGRFCSIADGVQAGLAQHPIDWVSTSPAFYYGKDSIPKNLAKLDFQHKVDKTIIGNDVWIGQNAMLKSGIVVGNGAIIGMGAVVTKNVPPYSIVAGNPAKIIRKRFTEDIIQKLEKTEWWNLEINEISKIAVYMNCPEKMIEEFYKL